jgi:hypothetical protein
LNDNQIIRLEKMSSYFEQGFITEEEYHLETENIYNTPDEQVPEEWLQPQDEQHYEEQYQEQEQPQEDHYSQLSDEQRSQISRLEQFLQKGYITQQEFENKVAQITNASSQQTVVSPKPSGKFTQEQQSQLDKLATFLQKGYITQQEYEKKRDQIHNDAGVPVPVQSQPVVNQPAPQVVTQPVQTVVTPKPVTQPVTTPKVQAITTPSLTQEQQQQITRLQQFLQKGIVTQQEFDTKKAQIEGTAKTTVQPTITPTQIKPVTTPVQPIKPITTPQSPIKPLNTTPTTVQLTQEQQQQITRLQQFVQKGIITQQEFEQKKAQIESNVKVSPVTTPKSPIIPQKQISPVSTPKSIQTNLTQEQKNQISKLQQFAQKGIITQQEFEQKKAQIEGKSVSSSTISSPTVSSPTSFSSPTTSSPVKPIATPPRFSGEQQTQLERLQTLRSRNIINEQEYQVKKTEIERKAVQENTPQMTSHSHIALSQEQQQQLTRLQQFVQKGIISQQEFDTKKSMIEKEALQNQQGIPVQSNTGAQSVMLTVFLNNIPASISHPLTVLLNRNNVMYTRSEDIPSGKSVVVKGSIPTQPGSDLVVTLTIKIPSVGIDSDQEFNLTQHGAFVLLGLDPNDNKSLVIKQQNTEDFPTPEPVVQQSQQNRPQGITDIFIYFAGIPAGEHQPFEIFINDVAAHKATQDMGQYQKGMIKGQVPKSKRSNAPSSSDHEILFTVKVPKLGVPDVVQRLNLTRDGSYVMVSAVGSRINVVQSHTDESDSMGKPSTTVSIPTGVTKEPKKLTDEDLMYLKKLSDLKNMGILTEEEFNKKKNEIIGL